MGRSKGDHSGRSIIGADFLQLTPPAAGLADWLTDRLRTAITDGRLPVGSRLPATRVLADELRVSRGVITEAYRRLSEDGLAAGHGRAGTVVLAAPASVPRAAPADPPPVSSAFTERPDLDFFDSWRAIPAHVDLSPGVPDLAAFPRAAWLRAERRVLDGLSPAAFGYGDPRGAPAFRAAVAAWLARTRGISVSPDEVIVVAGVAQALALLAQVLRRNGIGEIAAEDPGSLGARRHLENWGMRTVPVPVDAGGADIGALTSPAALVTPAHQFPTGVVLDGPRRRSLLRWAVAGGLVVEDDYDAEHRYDRPPVSALRSMLADQVCYAGSVSKLLAPALRVGWLLVPRRYFREVVGGKRDSDLGNAVLPQLVLADLMTSGELERQLRLLRRRHRRRRDAMVAALGRFLPGARVHGAAAGLHLMVTFDADLSDVDLAAGALSRGVKVQPLSWHRHRPGPPGLVLGYAATSPAEIEHGIEVLADVMSRHP